MGEASPYFAVHNRNKSSLAVDLKHPGGTKVLDRLISWADVLVTNYTAGVPERLGFGYERASGLNPRLIMVHVTGFGLTGRRRQDTSYDGIIQAMSGIAGMTGQAGGPPSVSGLFLADNVSGLQATVGVLLALAARERTGRGQFVDVSMLDGLVPMLAHHVAEVTRLGLDPHRQGNAVPTAFGNVYPARDGWVYLEPLTNRMWQGFCEVVGRPEWVHGERYAMPRQRVQQRAALEEVIVEWTRTRTRSEIVEALRVRGVACGPVNSVADVAMDPDVREHGMVETVTAPGGEELDIPGVPLKLSGTPARASEGYPALGADTAAVLRELGFTPAEIMQLRVQGIVGGDG